MKFVAGLFGGFILAVLGAFLITTMLAASPGLGGASGAIGFFICWLIAFVIALTAPSAPKAWRRLLLTSSVIAFLLPLAGIVYTGSFMATNIDSKAEHATAQAAGAAIGGGIVSGILGFVGFFIGVVLLIIGLLVGRDKQVVYVQAPPGAVAAPGQQSDNRT